jgi:hypothetical protein
MKLPRLRNQFAFRHSLRNLPLKNSMKPCRSANHVSAEGRRSGWAADRGSLKADQEMIDVLEELAEATRLPRTLLAEPAERILDAVSLFLGTGFACTLNGPKQRPSSCGKSR